MTENLRARFLEASNNLSPLPLLTAEELEKFGVIYDTDTLLELQQMLKTILVIVKLSFLAIRVVVNQHFLQLLLEITKTLFGFRYFLSLMQSRTLI